MFQITKNDNSYDTMVRNGFITKSEITQIERAIKLANRKPYQTMDAAEKAYARIGERWLSQLERNDPERYIRFANYYFGMTPYPVMAKRIKEMNESLNESRMSTEARELELFIENDSQLYRSQYMPIVKNLVNKAMKGVYDRNKAVKFMMYLVDAGAKKYVKEMGSPDQPWHKLFTKKDRLDVANALLDTFEEEANYGNWDDERQKQYKDQSLKGFFDNRR